ncbi:hypothetical protein KAJ89_04060 [Candidatus Parcubacteria bacterium]|nr:hypothetical protein [Candidatus Parcubacteria bacterium]
MAKLETKLSSTDATVNRIEKKMDDFIKCANKKFAGKWTEKFLVWGGGVVGTCILVALMALILK